MNRRDKAEFDRLEELLWQAENPPAEDFKEEIAPEEDFDDFLLGEDFESDIIPENDFEDNFLPREDSNDDIIPEDDYFLDVEEAPMVYRNYANSYARQPQPAEPVCEEEFYDDEPEEELPPPRTRPDVSDRAVKKESKQKRKKRRRGCGCGCLTWLLGLIVVIAAASILFIQPPKSDASIGSRKSDTATILICGTDKDGTRTDTMMLLYLSGSERKAGLLSLPRDSYTITASGNAAKLNSAYGRNGCGEEGMEVLMDYVKNIIGYRPDGYILVDFTLVPQIVDIMGGVDVDVPVDMDVEGVFLKAGQQHLTGEQVLAVLRYRKGYATADLGRIEVQRTVLKACMEQWLTLGHIGDALDAVSALESSSLTSLSTGNYIWMAKALLLGMRNFRSDTLPGVAEYRGGASYYILNRSQIAELVNESYNPYKVTITANDLNIAG